MKQITLYFLLISFIYTGYGQNTTYYKEIDLYDDARNTGFTIAIDSMDFYVSGKALCVDTEQDTFTCMSLSKYNERGEVLWKQNLPWTNSANDRSIVFSGDTLIVSGHQARGPLGSNSMTVLTKEGELISVHDFFPDTTLVANDDPWLFNNGLLKANDDIYIYGDLRFKNDSVGGYLFKTNTQASSTEFLTYLNGAIGAPRLPMQDLTLDQDSSLVFASEVRLPSRSEIRLITKLDLNGAVIDQFAGPDYDHISSVSPNLTLLKDGSYVYTYNIPFTSLNADFVPQLISSTPTGEINWTYDYPEEIVGVRGLVRISEIHTADNGDIYGCGSRERLGLEPVGRDAYIFRMSPQGEMLWERFYNIALREGERSRIGLRDIAELADGSLVAIGSVSTEEGVLMPIFRVDADGCIEGEDCEETNFLTTVEEILDASLDAVNIQVSPNPVSDRLQLTFSESISGLVQIFDMRGLQVYSGRLQQSVDSLIDVSELGIGSYAVVVWEDSGAIYRVVFAKE